MKRNERIDAAVAAMNSLELPELILALSLVADHCFESASELESAWGDKPGTSLWNVAAKKLHATSDKLSSAWASL